MVKKEKYEEPDWKVVSSLYVYDIVTLSDGGDVDDTIGGNDDPWAN